MLSERDVLMRELVRVTRKRKQAEDSAAALAQETHRLILDGCAKGVPKAELARAAGLTRPTVYSILYRSGTR